MGHRYYDANTGRFLTRDPIGYAGGINQYAYADDNPVGGADPDGTSPGAGQYTDFSGYLSDVGGVFKGYASLFNPVAWHDGIASLAQDAGYCGFKQAGIDLLNGIWNTFTDWTTTDDPDRFGQSFGATLAAAAGGAAGDVADADSLLTNCFVAGTDVQMADGTTKPIEDVRVGDKVKSRDPLTGLDAIEPVVQTYKHVTDQVIDLHLSDGETFTCTPEHRFYVEGKGFEQASELTSGDTFSFGNNEIKGGHTAQIATVSDVAWRPEATSIPSSTEVYNFEVANTHTYFVGATDGGVWVHNSCIADNKLAGDNFRDEVAAGFEAQGENVQTEYSVNTPLGRRRIDVAIVDNNGNLLRGYETKVGTSQYLPLQQAKDSWIATNFNTPIEVLRW